MDSIWLVSSQQRLDENSVPISFGTVIPGAKFAVLNFLDTGKLPGLSDAIYLGGLKDTEELWSVYFPAQGELPTGVEYEGVVLSGGEYSVYDPALAWTSAVEMWIRRVVDAGETKLLGLCYGCQLIAQALGGQVASNLSSKFLFLPDLVSFQGFFASLLPNNPELYLSECHNDCVVSLPNVGELLGQSSSTQVEAWGVASRVICTQGHPEFSSAYMRLCYLPSLVDDGMISSSQLASAIDHYLANPPSSILLSTLRNWLHSTSP
jgi:GMP synthase-like glutamine amidotransferase